MKKILEHCLWWLLAVLVFLLIIGSWLSVWFLQPRYFPEWEVAGQSGDMFGSLNALFSGLAFAGFLITMFMQRRDLAVQSVQLAESAKLQTAQFELLKEDKIHRERLQNLSFEPHFMLRARNVFPDHFTLALHNGRGTIFDLAAGAPEASEGDVVGPIILNRDTILEKGETVEMDFNLQVPTSSVVTYSFDLRYTTGLDEVKTVRLSIRIDHAQSTQLIYF